MIYTVTFNPSLDYVVDVKTFKTGQVIGRNRRKCSREERESTYPSY